jgi:hypothetical protein
MGQSLFAFDFADEANGQERLMQDLLIVDYWNQRLEDRLPVTYNHLLQGGYFSMPSARMSEDGQVGAGFGYIPPYHHYSLRCQLIERLEITFNYRVFKGVADPVLGELGFGDYSDKGANVKFELFSAEDSEYALPGVAIGFDDIMGTRSFKAYYIVFTKVWLKYNFELSVGLGKHRIRGLFGGCAWMPFRNSCYEYLRNLSFVLEYDAIPYWSTQIEPHPHGRKSRSRINGGIKYRLWDSIDLSLAYIRGDALAITASSYFNFGATKGMMPKIQDPLPYRAPANLQPIGYLRPEDVFVQDLTYALSQQGFDLLEAWLCNECDQKILRLRLINFTYRKEKAVRERLDNILAYLVPSNISYVIVTIDAGAFPVQEYHYNMTYLEKYRSQSIGKYELDLLTPLHEVSFPDPYCSTLLFKKDKGCWNMELSPKTNFLFGSAKGKFKYAVGLSLAFNGFLYDDIFYSVNLGYFVASNLYDLNDVDRLNPSQLINVRTDIINYYKQKSITVDEAYIQKISNLGKGWYTRTALGYFEPAYGGAAGEVLYYPVNSPWAIGAEAAVLKKRTYKGIGFTDKFRKLVHFEPTYQKFAPSQYFLNMYYDWKCESVSLKVSAGKFLANDYGARFEVCRYYPSGFRLYFWYTHTSGHDYINGKRYQDKGVGFSVPLDIFYTCSSRSQWGYGMSAWLRDIGAKAYTGPELYYLINDQRQ